MFIFAIAPCWERSSSVCQALHANISCQRVFGFKDWSFHIAKIDLGLSTNGITIWMMNKTQDQITKV